MWGLDDKEGWEQLGDHKLWSILQAVLWKLESLILIKLRLERLIEAVKPRVDTVELCRRLGTTGDQSSPNRKHLSAVMVGWLLMVCAGGGRQLWLNPVRLVPAITVGFFFTRFFQSGPFLKSYLNLLHYFFCLIFWIFGHQACGILAPLLGIEPHALCRKVKS